MGDTGEGLNASIEKLVDRMEKMLQQKVTESSQTENLMNLLDRMAVTLSRIEDGKNVEAEVNRKIEMLNQSLEKAVVFHEKVSGQQAGGERTFDRVVNGVKIFGLILSTLANSIQLTAENIGNVIKSPDAPVKEGENSQTAKTQADLSTILQPVSTLVRNLVEEKMKQQETKQKADLAGTGGRPDGKTGESAEESRD